MCIAVVVLLVSIANVCAQYSPGRITVKFTTDHIKIDGILDEEAWEAAEISPEFWQYFPSDSLLAEHQTRLRLLYNDHTLYAGIRAEKAEGDYVISSLRRDFGGASSDNVVMMFDTFSDD